LRRQLLKRVLNEREIFIIMSATSIKKISAKNNNKVVQSKSTSEREKLLDQDHKVVISR
jgi:hypothetical protein